MVDVSEQLAMVEVQANAAEVAAAGDVVAQGQRLDELKEMLDAYNQVTTRLHESHEALIGEVQRLRGELATANAALQRSRRLAALGEMAAGIAHEIRNPLGSIQLYAGMLAEELAGQDGLAQWVNEINVCVHGANGIVNDVLNFSREIKVRGVEIEVEELLGRALKAMDAALKCSECDVVVDVAEGLSLVCDIELMHQVMVNLLQNGLQAMDGGGVVHVSAMQDGGDVVIEVSDEGVGVSAEDIDRIFNPFFTTRHTGTGLGLAIVHRIIDAHHGSITVHNQVEGKGAVFTLTLPCDGLKGADVDG